MACAEKFPLRISDAGVTFTSPGRHNHYFHTAYKRYKLTYSMVHRMLFPSRRKHSPILFTDWYMNPCVVLDLSFWSCIPTGLSTKIFHYSNTKNIT